MIIFGIYLIGLFNNKRALYTLYSSKKKTTKKYLGIKQAIYGWLVHKKSQLLLNKIYESYKFGNGGFCV